MKYSYITFLGSDNYLIGTLALIESLKAVRSKKPIVVLVSNAVSNKTLEVLEKMDIKYIKVKDIKLPKEVSENNKTVNQSQWDKTFGKLYIFGMTDFDKLVFLDSDIFVKENIDELFDKPNMSAVFAGKSYPGNEEWEKSLNSGVMVITPQKGEDERLFTIMEENIDRYGESGIGDQDIIHMGYPKWSKNPKLEMNEKYNVFALYEPYYVSTVLGNSSIKALHFIGSKKPWNMSFGERKLYLIKRLVKQLILTKSFKGDLTTIRDFNSYCSLCDQVRKELSDNV